MCALTSGDSGVSERVTRSRNTGTAAADQVNRQRVPYLDAAVGCRGSSRA